MIKVSAILVIYSHLIAFVPTVFDKILSLSLEVLYKKVQSVMATVTFTFNDLVK